MFMGSKVYLAGHRGLVGSAIHKELVSQNYENILTRTHAELDLTRQADVESFFGAERPDVVILSAARVGGILANSTYPAEFIYQNLAIAANVVEASHRTGVRKLVNLGSSCIYPKYAPQPMKEEYFMTGPLEPTNEAYAIAKIAAIRLCKHYNEQYGTNYISVMPTNMYGPGDNFDLTTGHVLPAMIRKFHEAKVSNDSVTLWGDGTPYREFLYSEDLARAIVFLIENVDAEQVGEFINIGSGREVSIRELSEIVAAVVGYSGQVHWDTSKPNGTPRKLLDSSRLFELGWRPRVGLEQGIQLAYESFLESYA